MKSGSGVPISYAALKKYVEARKMLCREQKATMITLRKSTCSKELYKVMLTPWKKLVANGNSPKRFVMAMPAVAKKVAATCVPYATKKGTPSERAARKRFLTCSTAFIKGETKKLKKLFVKARMKNLSPLIVLKDDDGKAKKLTFAGALTFLSVFSCANGYPNTKSLYPMCIYRGGSLWTPLN